MTLLIDQAPLFLKGLVDLDRARRLVATGSSPFELGARTREVAGRQGGRPGSQRA